jgi:DNA-binding GntR family transcriptional regulator
VTASYAAPADGASATSRVHELIRSDILNGRHPPQAPLRLAALAREFDVSMSVVREALFRLAEQQLVTLSPNQGFRVVAVSRKDLIDLTDVRVDLECTALRRSIELGDLAWEASVVSAHHVLENTAMGGSQQWTSAHQAFHEALCAGCDNERLLALTRTLRNNAEVYRQLLAIGMSQSQRDVPAEHRELLRCATGREADGAVTCLRSHLEGTRDLLLATVFVES